MNDLGIPPAEFDVNISLVESLIREQCPEYAHLPVSFLSNGWDNCVFRLGKDYLVRIPRRKVGVEFLQRELEWLPLIADRLTMGTSVAIWKGKASDTFPWPWCITPWYEGENVELKYIDATEAERWANFLISLHLPAPKEVPINIHRGVPLTKMAKGIEGRLKNISALTNLINAHIMNIWHSALEMPVHTENLWLHGDLHPGNLIAKAGKIQAVIDWGDICQGDPAVDLSSIWMLFKQEKTRQEILEIYDCSTELMHRSKGWVIHYGTIFLESGLESGNRHYEKMGRQILENLI